MGISALRIGGSFHDDEVESSETSKSNFTEIETVSVCA